MESCSGSAVPLSLLGQSALTLEEVFDAQFLAVFLIFYHHATSGAARRYIMILFEYNDSY